MIVDKLSNLVVEKLSPFRHGWLGTNVRQKPESSFEATDLVFGPTFLLAKVWNAEFDNEVLIVVSNEIFFGLSSLARVHIRKDVLPHVFVRN